MERTISARIDKGSIAHNNRKFISSNVDYTRTKNNIVLCQENIKKAYKDLFDDALSEYNQKQTRKDRIITDYYSHIASGKQEKPFYELIFQIGNSEDTACGTSEAELSAKILTEFYDGFKERNSSNHRIINATLHLDEACPHLHIDVISFAINQKRGLSTRVSLSKALEQQGFKSKDKFNTAAKLWIDNEKKELSKVMKKYGVEWKQLGTHNEHLSVLDFKKKKRAEEIEVLDKKIVDKNDELKNVSAKTHNEYIHARKVREEAEKIKKSAERVSEEAELRARVARLNSNMLQQIAMINDDINRKEQSKFQKETAELKTEFQAFQEMIERFKEFVKEEVHKIKDSQTRTTRIEEIEKELFSFNRESDNLGEYIKSITQKGKQKQKDRSL